MHTVGAQRYVSLFPPAKHEHAPIMAYDTEIPLSYTPPGACPGQQKDDHTGNGIQPHL